MRGCQLALQALQSKTIEALTQSVLTRHLVTKQMKSYLARLQLDVEKLRVIHVAGTKGKGSTSAFTERICREHGLRTGLYTSPDLVHITERFRVNGVPIREDVFLEHFWLVWDGLVRTQDQAAGYPPIPSYFRYLTLVAYHLFLHHAPHIDVLILEVGIGGKLDATNILQRPVVCGISSIGFDHMEILGYTLEEIAQEKAGIIKPGVPIYTVSSQAPEVKTVFRQVAEAENAPLTFVEPADKSLQLGLAGWHQYENAGLAIALAKEYFLATGKPIPDGPLPGSFLTALKETSWPGRCQRLEHPNPQLKDRVTFFIDGAHTDASMKIACQWLQSQEPASSTGTTKCHHVLLFNCGHIRDPIELMIPLVSMGYPAAASSFASTSAASSTAAAPASSGVSSSTPIHFDRIICTPFDHDRPHLASAPTFEKLLTNYLQPQHRRSNVSVAAQENANAAAPSSPARKSSVDIRSHSGAHIHPVLQRFLSARFSFPSSSASASASAAPDDAAGVSACIRSAAEAFAGVRNLETFSPEASSTRGHTWQHTLFQVWQFLNEAFRHAEEQVGTKSIQPAQCTYAASAHDALQGLQQLVEKDTTSTPTSVFVVGSLYLVGNVLRVLDYRV